MVKISVFQQGLCSIDLGGSGIDEQALQSLGSVNDTNDRVMNWAWSSESGASQYPAQFAPTLGYFSSTPTGSDGSITADSSMY